MKSPEEIISQYEPNSEYPSYYHESKIIEMIKEAHIQACEAQRSQDGNIYWENRNKQDVFISNKIQYTPLIELK